tara:strand:- start:1272 stop:2249 length:978 start_codon:yes stop_codon:yes gene_type:complete
MNIIKPNNHKIDKQKLKLWLDNSDSNIKTIATEFILKTTHISYNIFKKFLLKSFKEMLFKLKTKTLQFFIISDNDEISYKFKSGYWIFNHLLNYINTKIYTIKMINDIKDVDLSIPVIIPDDASYSGSQISSFIENFENTTCDIYILIPFISNTAIDVIKNAFNEYNINGELYFPDNKYIMKPIYNLMEEQKIEKLFSYYTMNGKNIREYPIYFDHKVADNYSSFPLIYTYGIIPNIHNKNIIQMCKKYKIPLKNHFDELEKNPILKNCSIDLKYNIGTPPCPLQPYKKNFLEIKSKSTYLKSNKSLSNKSLSISRNKTKKNKSF